LFKHLAELFGAKQGDQRARLPHGQFDRRIGGAAMTASVPPPPATATGYAQTSRRLAIAAIAAI
jgi:hypothetical protein